MWSKHSSRTERIQCSAKAFAFGARTGVRMISTSSEVKTVSKAAGNLASRSWIRKRAGTLASWSAQLNCRASPEGYPVTQALVGFAVQPARWTRRLPSSMKNNTYSVFNQAVSTVKKSQATIWSL